MKAYLRPKITERQREELYKEADRHIANETVGIVRRYLKLTMIALNRSYGFGARRLSGLLKEITELSETYDTDEVFWTHADERLRQMGIRFDPEEE